MIIKPLTPMLQDNLQTMEDHLKLFEVIFKIDFSKGAERIRVLTRISIRGAIFTFVFLNTKNSFSWSFTNFKVWSSCLYSFKKLAISSPWLMSSLSILLTVKINGQVIKKNWVGIFPACLHAFSIEFLTPTNTSSCKVPSSGNQRL